MNKKLLALAVTGACVSPAAMAQTANPVTLYGLVSVQYESVEAKGLPSATLPRRNRISDEASRLGVRGTEDLGGGLRAFFQLETVFKADQNDSTFANRNSGVGLQGGWGSVLMGRWDTPLKVAANAMDPFGDVTLGAQSVATLGSGVNSQQGTFDIRQQNVVQYWSPSWAGIAVRLSMMANEARTATVNPRSQGYSITYTGGPVYVGFAYHELKDTAFGAAPGTVVTLPDQKINALLGSFTFGPVKVGGMYNKIKRSNGWTDQKAWVANVIWTLGNNQLVWQHQDAKDGGLSTAATQPKCKADSFGWYYNFSKRTAFLAQWSRVDNNDTGTCNYGTTPGPLTTNLPGQDLTSFGLGLRTTF